VYARDRSAFSLCSVYKGILPRSLCACNGHDVKSAASADVSYRRANEHARGIISGESEAMVTGVRIDIPQDKIADFCRRWKISELALFGSVLREDFRPDSDVDVLVTFAPDAKWSLFDHVDMEDELEGILGRPVDLVSRRGIERSRNPFRRKAILDSARVVHAA